MKKEKSYIVKNLNTMEPICSDDYLFPLQELALWQTIFSEVMGYNLFIEHKMTNPDGSEEEIIYHVQNKEDPTIHYICSYIREVKKKFDF